MITAKEADQLSSLTTEAWEQFRPHASQSQLWRTRARFVNVVAGRGSGKTALSRMRIARMLPVRKPWRDPIYVFCLPTFAQAKRVGWEKLLPLIPKPWIASENKSELCITTIYGSKVYIAGMDKPYRIEGMQIDGAVLDESSDQRPEAYTKTLLPMVTHRNGWIWRIGVPKRNGVGAVEFKKAYDIGLTPNKAGIESYTWASDTVLTPDQLEAERAQMSEKDALEQFGGVWVDSEGQIFYSYSDTENIDYGCTYDPNEAIGVGSDFNVSPMAWVLFHYSGGVMRVFDEIFMKDTNTQATLNELHKRYPIHRAGWTFIGDASSRARKTSATETDYMQIYNDMRFINKNVWYPDANPAVQDRFASTNALLKNANGMRRLFIHPKCTNLRADLQARTYKVGTREPDDKPGTDLGHITDALGYSIHYLCPMHYTTPSSKIAVVNFSGQSSVYSIV